jgi:diguanylate cyclase (GGDEF)-like protein
MMESNDALFTAEAQAASQSDLRHRIASLLLERIEEMSADTVALFPYTSSLQPLDERYCRRLGYVLVQLLAFAVRDGRVDSHGEFVADLHRMVLERTVPAERLFTFAYLTERTALDELALSDTIGATAEPWPLVAQLVRRGSFDMLAAYAERTQLEPPHAHVIDKLTTLYTQPMLEAVLEKEVERAGRYGYPLSLILFDVDRLSDINKEHGYGVGDRILERLGILIRKYFRQYDWVARHAEDSIVVILTRTDAASASDLAERVRSTVEERLSFTNHRNDQAVHVTVSAAAINVQVSVGDVISPDQLMADAIHAVERAKLKGRNRVERVDVRYPYSSS